MNTEYKFQGGATLWIYSMDEYMDEYLFYIYKICNFVLELNYSLKTYKSISRINPK